MMSTLEFRVYEIFKNKLGEKEAETNIQFVEEKSQEKIDGKKDVFLTKDDKVELVEKIESSKTDIIKWMFVFWIGQVAATIAIFKLIR